VTIFERVGGQPFFDRLVAEFYRSVRGDPVLLALYPQPDDLAPAQRRLAMFLAQYWGGPTAYSEERGHPRLRMRHAAYPIDDSMRDRWLSHMNAALDAVSAAASQRVVLPDGGQPPVANADIVGEMRDYFVRAADHLRNM
jgi:hemoglobin